MRLAALDYGTVTSRLLIGEVDAGNIKIISKQTIITHLGEGLDASGRISEEACDRVLSASRSFMDAIRAMDQQANAPDKVASVRAMATSAMRDASNSGELVAALAGLGISLEVISGRREAELSFAGTLSGFTAAELAGRTLLVADIGGGSTELTIGISPADGGPPVILQEDSLDIGARRLTDRCLAGDPPSPWELDAARAWVRGQLDGWAADVAEAGVGVDKVIGVAGTATSLVAIRERMAVYDAERVHGQFVSVAGVREILEMLAVLPERERRQMVGLEPERASVSVGGLIILDELLQTLGMQGFTVSETDILQGILLDSWRLLRA